MRSRGNNTVFINPEEVIRDDGSVGITEKNLQRLWKRMEESGYASIHKQKIFLGAGNQGNRRKIYLLDRDKIIDEFGQAVFKEEKPKVLRSTFVPTRSSVVAKRPAIVIPPDDRYAIPRSLLAEVNSKIDCDFAKLSWEMRATKKIGFGVRPVGRMTSPLCNVRKTERERLTPELFESGVTQYDIRSTIPTVLRLCNKGIWEERNARAVAFDGLPIGEREKKKIALAMTFSPSAEVAWTHYHWSHRKFVTKLTKEQFFYAWEKLIEEDCGGRNRWGGSLFYDESYIELLTIRNLQERGTFVGSVYDCFWSAGLSRRRIEAAVRDAAFEYYEDVLLPRERGGRRSRPVKALGLLSGTPVYS
jgi:hypothetical protein